MLFAGCWALFLMCFIQLKSGAKWHILVQQLIKLKQMLHHKGSTNWFAFKIIYILYNYLFLIVHMLVVL